MAFDQLRGRARRMLLVFIGRVHDLRHCREGADAAAPAVPADAEGSVTLMNRELAALRQELLTEMRRELHKFKSDIIDGVPRFLLVFHFLTTSYPFTLLERPNSVLLWLSIP